MSSTFYQILGLLFVYQAPWLVWCSKRPNIIFILADDLGWNDVSFHGSKQIPTPNIDDLAHSGINLNNYYVQPICTPTRSALLTGRHPIHTGMQVSVIVGPEPYGLSLNETLMPQYLKALGYKTHMVGKWHLGMFEKEYTPTFRGFDSHFGYWLGEEDYFDHYSFAGTTGKKYDGLDFRRNMEVERNCTGQYSTELFAAEAVTLIQKHNKSDPMFLYLPFQAVHSGNINTDPLAAPQKYIDRFPYIKNPHRKLYAAMVSALDDAVGQIIKSLNDEGMLQNSIIVFSTDNGGPSNGFDANAASNFPLRGLKATLWEGGVRGDGFIYSPLLEKSGYISEHLLHVCDWLPTLYRAAGGDPSHLKNLDGFDMWDVLSKDTQSVRTEILHNIQPVKNSSGIRVGEYKLLHGDVGMAHADWYPPWQSKHDSELFGTYYYDNLKSRSQTDGTNLKGTVPDFKEIGRSTLIRTASPRKIKWGLGDSSLKFSKPHAVKVKCGKKPYNASTNCNPVRSPCLFHIPSDPCEYNNIADQNPRIVEKLQNRIEEYRKTMVPPRNKPADPSSNPKYHGGVWIPWRSKKTAKINAGGVW